MSYFVEKNLIKKSDELISLMYYILIVINFIAI